MHGGDGYLESSHLVGYCNSNNSLQNIKLQNVNLNYSYAPDSKGDNVKSISWDEEYSQRLAMFMKNSKSLLENIDKKHQVKNNNNDFMDTLYEKSVYNTSESPTRALIELEEKLLQLEDPVKQRNKQDIKMSSKLFDNFKEMNSTETDNNEKYNKSEDINEVKKCFETKKHNFKEGLRIDELEDALYKLQKILCEKEEKLKKLQLELENEKKAIKIPKKVIYRNLVTEFNNDCLCTPTIKENEINDRSFFPEQNKIYHLGYKNFNNQITVCQHKNVENKLLDQIQNNIDQNEERNSRDNLSIKDYDPNSTTALKNRIKDLESQIQDLHEANELESQFIATIKENKSEHEKIDFNSVISELLMRNKHLTEEVGKLRQYSSMLNEDFLSCGFLRNELENLKEDLVNLKQQNNMIVIENIQLKNLIKQKGFLVEEINYSGTPRKQKRKPQQTLSHTKDPKFCDTNQMNENTDYEIHLNFEKNTNRTNIDASYGKSDFDVSNNSTDSIFSELNKEMNELKFATPNIEKRNEYICSQHYNKELLNNDFNVNSESTYFQSFNEPDRTTSGVAFLSNNMNKFSTLGRTAFSPRSATDIKINDVVKFIRQGGRISKGLVHFIGRLPKRNDIYLGIELEVEDGKHDGIYEGVRYFKCRTNKGVFVAFNKIIMVYSEKNW